MKSASHFNTVATLWADLGKESEVINDNVDLEIHKKLLNFFQVGEFYYFVFNLKSVELERKLGSLILFYAQFVVDVPNFPSSTYYRFPPNK